MARSCRLLQMQVGLPAPWPIRDGGRFSNAMCLLVAALAPIGVGLLLIGSAGGVPKPPPKFWSATRCERTVLHVSGGVPPTRGFPLPDSERPPLPRQPGDLCRKRRTARLSMDGGSSFPHLLGVPGVHAFSPQRRHCSLLHARHTDPRRFSACPTSRRRQVRRVAARLLCIEHQTGHYTRNPGTVPP